MNERKKKSTALLHVHEKSGKNFTRFIPHVLVDTIAHTRSFDLSFDQAYTLEFSQVLRHRRLRQGQMINDVTAHARFLPGEIFQYGHSGGMSQGLRKIGNPVFPVVKGFCFG
jgi:hypothetical protein